MSDKVDGRSRRLARQNPCIAARTHLGRTVLIDQQNRNTPLLQLQCCHNAFKRTLRITGRGDTEIHPGCARASQPCRLIRPAATATAEPLDEPPGTLSTAISQGFLEVPISALVPQPPKANSTICVRPRSTTPLASNLSTAVAVSLFGMAFFRLSEPKPVVRPRMANMCFTATGISSSGPNDSIDRNQKSLTLSLDQ